VRTSHRAFDASKRLFDVIVSLVGLLLSSPVILVVAILVRIKLGSPVIFTQERPGKNEKIFRLHKFRTMLNPNSDAGLVSDEDRLTDFGKKLRATSLDELPTLWNVLRGDMSIVGPRPLLVDYLQLYSPEQARRHAVRPGVTGLAQCNGRNNLDWDQKLRLDAKYVENRSWRLDLTILIHTPRSVIRQEGIAKEGHATMPKFHGSSL